MATAPRRSGGVTGARGGDLFALGGGDLIGLGGGDLLAFAMLACDLATLWLGDFMLAFEMLACDALGDFMRATGIAFCGRISTGMPRAFAWCDGGGVGGGCGLMAAELDAGRAHDLGGMDAVTTTASSEPATRTHVN